MSALRDGSVGQAGRTNLVADVSSFVGRRREIAAGKRLLGASRLLTITGSGGVGKTRLALRLAAAVCRAFPDGVWLVEMAGLTDPELVPHQVAGALRVHDSSGRPPMDVLHSYLVGRRLLLVIDNCEHLQSACARLASQLLPAAPSLRIIAASRHALGVPGEHVLEVPALAVPTAEDIDSGLGAESLAHLDSVRLFEHRACAVRPRFKVDDRNAAAVARLCRRLEGIPLAIELAAAQLRTLSVEVLLDRLDGSFRMLGSDTGCGRHESLRATIAWSYQLCSPAERLMWARLSVFAGDFDLEAADAVASDVLLSRADVLQLITGLVGKSVLRSEEREGRMRYRMLDTVGAFGGEILAASGGEDAPRRRHRDYYGELAELATDRFTTPDQALVMRRLRAEHDNIRAALAFSLAEPSGEFSALRISSALWCYWWSIHGLHEARRWLDQALELDRLPSRFRARALWVNGWFALTTGDLDTAEQLIRECLTLGAEIGDTAAVAYGRTYLGLLATIRGDLAGGCELLAAALEQHRALGEMNGILLTLPIYAMAASYAGDPCAVTIAAECLAFIDSHGMEMSRGIALWELGLAHRARGDLAAAEYLRESLRAFVAFDEWRGVAQGIEALAWMAAAEGDARRAARLLGAADSLWREVGVSPVTQQGSAEEHDKCQAIARGRLGPATYARAFREGADLGHHEAVAEALGAGSPRHPASAANPGRTYEERSTRAAAGARGAGPASLTRREREVAELLAQGLTNRQLADAMVISQRTAETHAGRVLRKLGCTSRSQVVARLAELERRSAPQLPRTLCLGRALRSRHSRIRSGALLSRLQDIRTGILGLDTAAVLRDLALRRAGSDGLMCPDRADYGVLITG